MSQNLEVRGFNLDAPSLAAIIALMVLGTVMVSSASISLADRDLGEPLFFLLRQLGALLIGCLVALTAMLIPTQVWFRLNWLLLLISMVLLISVLVPGLGHTVNGSTRWLDIGPLSLQPSEPARVCLILYLASYVVRHQQELGASLLGFLKPMFFVTLACVLLLAEPDFGAAVVLTVTSLGLLFVGGARLRDFVFSFLVALVALSATQAATLVALE